MMLKSQLNCSPLWWHVNGNKDFSSIRRNIKVLQRKIFPPVVSVVFILHSISSLNVVDCNPVLACPGPPLPTSGPHGDLCMTGLSLLLLAGLACRASGGWGTPGARPHHSTPASRLNTLTMDTKQTSPTLQATQLTSSRPARNSIDIAPSSPRTEDINLSVKMNEG